jgi:hypothetical protein
MIKTESKIFGKFAIGRRTDDRDPLAFLIQQQAIAVETKLPKEVVKNLSSWPTWQRQKVSQHTEYFVQKLKPLEPEEVKQASIVKNEAPELFDITQRGVTFDVQITQGYADITITQLYENDKAEPKELLFKMPL